MLNGNANNSAKQAILSEIRRNLAASEPFDAVHEEHHAHKKTPEIANVPIVSEADLQIVSLIERFRENLISVGGNCEVVESIENAAQKIQAIIEEKKAKNIAVSDSVLVEKTIGFLKTSAEFTKNSAASGLFDCDLGITGAEFAIAETGTLVLESDREFNRLTSLVPPVHVCLIETKKLRRTLGEVLQILNENGSEKLSRTITFITGPSRTSDIELTLAIGVHGPAELHVIFIEER